MFKTPARLAEYCAQPPPSEPQTRTFVVATGKRDKVKYPNPSDFVYELPIVLSGVYSVGIRDYSFGKETLINEVSRLLPLSWPGGSATLQVALGDHSNSITTLLTAINAAIDTAGYNIEFALNTALDRVVFRFKATGTLPGSPITIAPCALLRILGFTSTSIGLPSASIAIYSGGVGGPATATAPEVYDVFNLGEMVIRIAEMEALLSNDPITNRSTAILFSCDSGNTLKQGQDRQIQLLQKQNRLQRLHIRLLNMEGDYYDTVNNEAIFILEVLCDSNL